MRESDNPERAIQGHLAPKRFSCPHPQTTENRPQMKLAVPLHEYDQRQTAETYDLLPKVVEKYNSAAVSGMTFMWKFTQPIGGKLLQFVLQLSTDCGLHRTHKHLATTDVGSLSRGFGTHRS